MNGIKNMETATVLTLKDQVSYQPGQVVSKTLAQNNALSVTLFAFDKGEEISTHESGGDAFVTCLDGMVVRPSSNLPRAEAAVMLQNILDLPQSQEAAVFSEDCAVPVWAQASVSALESAGISIPVTTSAENLTRREAAELLYECWTLCQNRETAASRLSK